MSSYTQFGVGLLEPTKIVWQERLAEKIFSETGDRKLKSSWDLKSMYWNTSLIDKMTDLLEHKQWLPGANRALAIAKTFDVSESTAESFIENLGEYVGKDLRGGPVAGLLDLIHKVIKGAGETAEKLPWIMIILATGVMGYLIFAGRKGVKLTPF
jgi:hypothetical protein